MTAAQVISEIDRLPPKGQEAVIVHDHELEAAMIPDSFAQGMAEAGRGEMLDMEDAHFDFPPV